MATLFLRLVVALVVVLILVPLASARAEAPLIEIESPASGTVSNHQTPSFSGSTDDSLDEVTLTIYLEGAIQQTLTTFPFGTSWSVGPASSLADGVYTAQASQTAVGESNVGETGVSEPVTFTVDTSSPTVTLNQPSTPSKDTTPSFTGEASDTTPVVVQIHEGSAAGPVVASAEASGTGGGWTSGVASPALPEGSYTAVATQESSLGNEAGRSAPVSFVVSTASPSVTLNPVTTPSKDTTPSFTGDASDTTPVVVQIHEGSAGGRIVASAEASGTGGGWTSGVASPALPEGSYTAVATQESSLGNEAGESSPVSFVVRTAPPTVTLQAPTSPSNNTKPAFAGTASDTKPVIVHVLHEGVEVAKATATGNGGSWKSGATTPALATGKTDYTAYATQESSLGNPPGESAPVSFEVNTEPPTVTLNQPLPHSNDATPSFAGTTTDTTTVTVNVYLLENKAEHLIATVGATPAAGSWQTAPASLHGGRHTYIAVAEQESSLGNASGTSARVTFAVDTEAPTVTMNAPASPTNDATPTFSGSATEREPVVVQIFAAGTTISGKPVATATATGTGNGWTSAAAAPALADGEYVATATQGSAYGHEPGGAGPVPFTVDTVAPAVAIGSSRQTSASSQLLEGSAGLAPGDSATVTVQLFDGSEIGGALPTQSIQVAAIGGHWSATLGGLAPGAYVARAEQPDTAGNVGISAPTNFSINQAAVAPLPLPTASFSWLPSAPRVGERVSFLSSSTDLSSPLAGYAWDLAGDGTFAAGGPTSSTTFTSAGMHTVQLRVSDAAGRSSTVAATVDVAAAPPTLLQPFPTVKISAVRLRSGVVLKVLSVRAPAGSQIGVRCTGRGCPAKSQSRVATASAVGAASIQFRKFERFLRPGIVIEVRVVKVGQIGKYTRFTVRRAQLPTRTDLCIASATAKPVSCP